MVVKIQTTFDCADPQRLAAFWAVALEYVPEPPPPGYPSWAEFASRHSIPRDQWRAAIVDPAGHGPRLYFQPVPEGKTAKNRVHLDVQVGVSAADAEERRRLVTGHARVLTEAGATMVREQDDQFGYCIVMLDPEGNEFCVA